MLTETTSINSPLSLTEFKNEVLEDFRLAYLNRHLSLIGRKEVLSGKAKFGIFGDGKELAQIAMAKQFKNGDWRSGYYRENTFMMAAGLSNPKQFFAQLYSNTKISVNPGNGGRSMNNHFATQSINEDGTWKDILGQKNSAADLSPTAGQIPRLLGLGYASKLFRNEPTLKKYTNLSNNGNEIAFGMIGDASTSEGHFFEMLNAAAVLQVPVALAVWDDGYGISVPREVQTVKNSISEALKGFIKSDNTNGIIILKAKGWDYPALCRTFEEGIKICREEHVPVLFHIEEMTQPQGHSTSGSHERYKSPERLNWESEFDPLKKMREWILEKNIATTEELDEIEASTQKEAQQVQVEAWEEYQAPIKKEREELIKLVTEQPCTCKTEGTNKIKLYISQLQQIKSPIRKDILSTAKKIQRHICNDCPILSEVETNLKSWITKYRFENFERYNDKLHNDSQYSVLNVEPVGPTYKDGAPMVHGREIIRDNFEALFKKHPLLLTFGEDSGKIGDVNQGLEGLQEKFGVNRVTDTGIRESTIIGQGIGLALRGLRPIAEIQYLDYIYYTIQTLSDDVASIHWRSKGSQSIPLIVRTRGHRLEGIWHSGSPMGMIINAVRGIYVCVPRNMTQAAAMYNTLLEGQDPAIVVEPLNAYRLEEKRPDNLGEFKVQLGCPEILEVGSDITLVTYGSCVRIAQEAIKQLKEFNISVELIDVQTLLPFDINETIVESVKKTNRVVFLDEDVPGGASAFMMQKVIEEQDAYKYLDSAPKTITAKEHRPAYSSDGDYFSKPNAEDIFETIYDIMRDVNPGKYRELY